MSPINQLKKNFHKKIFNGFFTRKFSFIRDTTPSITFITLEKDFTLDKTLKIKFLKNIFEKNIFLQTKNIFEKKKRLFIAIGVIKLLEFTVK
jgi:hypothetical protein